MATPTLELRPVPPNADAFAHRGPDHLVRAVPRSFLAHHLADQVFTPDPTDTGTDGGTRCLPFHVVEGLYARLASSSDLAWCPPGTKRDVWGS